MASTERTLIQVHIPLSTPQATASCLHDDDLASQPQEVLRVLRATDADMDWHDPTTRAWRGCNKALAFHGMLVCVELMKRGIIPEEFGEIVGHVGGADMIGVDDLPVWWGEEHHEEHKALLIRLRPDFYADKWPEVDSSMPMMYPGAENIAFRQTREVITKQREANRALEVAQRAQAEADAARRRALELEYDKEQIRRQRRREAGSNNGWGR